MFGATWENGVDLIAIERAVALERPYPVLTDEEVERALREMTAAGRPVSKIAEVLGTNVKAVERWRKRAEAASS